MRFSGGNKLSDSCLHFYWLAPSPEESPDCATGQLHSNAGSFELIINPSNHHRGLSETTRPSSMPLSSTVAIPKTATACLTSLKQGTDPLSQCTSAARYHRQDAKSFSSRVSSLMHDYQLNLLDSSLRDFHW